MKSLLIGLLATVASFSALSNESADTFFNNFDTDREEYSVKFGGWSHHGNTLTKKMFQKHSNKNFEYNEDHSGLGFEYSLPYKDTNHYFTAGVWYMKDSFNMDAFHAGVGYKHRLDIGSSYMDSIDFNLVLTYFNRSRIFSTDHFMKISGVDEKGNSTDEKLYINKTMNAERTSFVLPAPYITFNITKNINIDTMILLTPAEYRDVNSDNNDVVTHSSWEKVFFIRAGFTF